ncbi:MAG: sugar transferase [Halothece sp. Uz-M2-17]|nr:sugar transferase [Halothece sp. Uz-M2-17]
MKFSSILLKTSTVLTLPATNSDSPLDEVDVGSPCRSCRLRWRQKQLWVKPKGELEVDLPALSNEVWLSHCLQCSGVKQIYLDRRIGKEAILTWATLARQANKEVWLRLPGQTKNENVGIAGLIRVLDWLVAIFLLVLVSPCFLFLMLSLKVINNEVIFEREWCVDDKGRLFERITFSTHLTLLKHTRLDQLPQLWNVFKGDMRLFGFRPLKLEEALRFN